MRIYSFLSPVLTEKTKRVTDFGKDFQNQIDLMLSVMGTSLGVGLAAPQVGESLKFFVAAHENKKYVIVNPKIVWRSFENEIDIEGCLSIPNFQKQVERSKTIGIIAQNRYGDKIEMEVTGYLARIFQHEIDHLNGILIN